MWIGILLLGAGCGGGGSNRTPRSASPHLSIDWPARSRSFSGLSSAQSVQITIRRGLENGADVRFVGNRTDSPGAYTGNYVSPQPVTLGVHQVDLKFFADAAAEGAEVGSASVSAKVRPDGELERTDGTPLGTVQTTSAITTVSVVPDQTVNAGSSAQLAFTAQNAAAQVVALSAGSATFAVTSGADKLSVSPSGIAQGLSLGEATVVVTVDQVTSPVSVVTVTAPPPAVRSFDANTNSIAFDSSRNLIYATVPGTDATNPNAFVAYNPALGTVVKSVTLPAEPYGIALSDDFQYAYLTQNAIGKVARVDLESFTVGQTFALAPDRTDEVFHMRVRPGHPNQVAVTRFLGGGSESNVTIYDNGVAEPNIGDSFHTLAFDGPNKLYAGHFGSMTAFSVDDTGVTPTLVNVNAPGHSYNSMGQAGGRLYLNTYDVIDGNTLAVLGTFPSRKNSSTVVPDPIRNYAFGLTWSGPPDRVFQVFRKSDFGQHSTFTIPDVGNSTSAFVQMSSNSFAFNVAGPSKIFIVENVYLP